MKKKWLDELKNKMEDHQVQPPKDLWNTIDKELFSEKVAPEIIGQEPTKKPIKRRWVLPSIAAAATILFAGAALWTSLFSDTSKKPLESIAERSEKLPIENRLSTKQEVVSTPPHAIQDNSGPIGTNNAFNHLYQEPEKVATFRDLKQNATERNLQEHLQALSPTNSGIILHKRSDIIQNDLSVKKPILHTSVPLKEKAGKQNDRSSRFSFGFSSGQFTPGMSSQMGGFGMLAAAPLESIGPQVSGDLAIRSMIQSNESKLVETKTDHKKPFNTGIGASYRLNDRFSLSSGLSYSRAVSTLTSGSTENHISTKQTLNYVGIPLSLNYRIWEKEKLSTYATAGGQVQKMVAGNHKTTYTLEGESSESKTKIGENPVQISVHSGVGAELRLHKNVSLYVEPGAIYHFDDNSSIPTIYKEKAWQFNFKSGIRLNFK